MRIEFVCIPSIKELFNLIKGAKGNVYIQLSEEKFFDLKESINTTKELDNVLQHGKNIVLHIFDTSDYLDFINFMTRTIYDEPACT